MRNPRHNKASTNARRVAEKGVAHGREDQRHDHAALRPFRRVEPDDQGCQQPDGEHLGHGARGHAVKAGQVQSRRAGRWPGPGERHTLTRAS